MTDMQAVFTPIYQHKLWAVEDASGTGSTLEQTAAIREQLPEFFHQLDVRSVLDIPCGTYNWWSHMEAQHSLNMHYIGADVVPELIEENRQHYPHVDFRVLDITKDDLPQVDLIFVRDLLGHLSNADVAKALDNIVRARPRFLITTTFPNKAVNIDIETGKWRPINMGLIQRRHGLKSIALMDEKLLDANGKNIGKCLGVYDLGKRDSVTGA